MGAPIKLTFYNKNDEPAREFSRSFIPWALLRKASRLADQMGDEKPAKKKRWFSFLLPEKDLSPEEQQMLLISEFVVELFGHQFSVQELENGADIGEVMSVFQSILTRANATVRGNPTPPPSSKRNRH